MARAAPGLALVLLALPLIVHRLGSYAVVNGDEAVYHGIAQRMVETGDWLHLDFVGEHRVYDTFMNAPLQYWVRALLITAFGSSTWTMRIPSAVFGVLSVWLTWRLGLVCAGRSAAFLAGLIQLTTLHFVYLHSARTGELETAITFTFSLAALLFLRAALEGRRFAAHHLCLVVLMNLKAPFVIVPLAAELLCFALIPRARPRLRRWAIGLVVALPLGLLWHGVQMVRLWEPFQDVVRSMLADALEPGAGTLPTPLRNALFYERTLLFAAWPYALAYPLAVVGVLRARLGADERERWWVLAAFAAALFGFYLLVSQHHRHYVVPAYPMLSLFAAGWLAQIARRTPDAFTLGSVGLAAAFPAWAGVPLRDFNPFASQALFLPMEVSWRSVAGIGPVLGLPLSAAALALALAALRRPIGARFGRVVAGGLAGLLVGIAALRVALPLEHLGHQSRMARLRRTLDVELAAGRALAFPIPIAEPGLWRARFYFGEDFEVVPLPEERVRETGVFFLLHRKNDPRWLDQSVSRTAREWRERSRPAP